ncbi:MAG: ATP-binding protein [Candidatus Symbiothrix sp.]|jgi:predicted AAA+ superfamily ATPase|nr:ATP-binding protein [Candidatus Symbiothrix sp.]
MQENNFIIRSKYQNKITPFIGKQLIKVLTGQRRVGKSFILKQIILQIEKEDPTAHILYINKEDMSFDSIQTAHDLNNYVLQHTKEGIKNYVFIDEIQEIAQFEKAMRSLLLNPTYDLYCTGSNANMLSGELSTFLSGRFIEIPIFSLSYNEFLLFHQLENSNTSLMSYLKFGGLPYLKHLDLKDDIVYDYLKGVYNTIIYRDVILRNEIRNTAFLENLTLFLSDNIGHLFSAKKISNYLMSQQVNIATSQVLNYLNHLSSAYLVHRVKRMNVNGKKIFEIGEKFYFEDLGLRNAIFEYKQTDIGKIMENAVYKHLLYNDYEVKIGQLGQNEIDFVCKRKGEYLYLQVCYLLQEQATIDREFGNLEKIKDNYPKMVVSMDEFSGNTRNGIQHIHLRDFLSKTL